MQPSPSPRGLSLIVDPETLLLDVDCGIRQALERLSRAKGGVLPRALAHSDLRNRPMREVLALLAGSDDAKVVGEFADRYWQIYSKDTRFQAPMRQGSIGLVASLQAQAVDLHYLSTLGPAASARMLQTCGLDAATTSIFTSPEPSCPCARPALLENFICASPRAPQSWLLLSDNPVELQVARRLGVPALALAYDAGARLRFDAGLGMIGIAWSPGDVLNWLDATVQMRSRLQLAADRAAVRLHGSCAP